MLSHIIRIEIALGNNIPTLITAINIALHCEREIQTHRQTRGVEYRKAMREYHTLAQYIKTLATKREIG